MEKNNQEIIVNHEGTKVILTYPVTGEQVFIFEKEEDAEKFVVNCKQLDAFMDEVDELKYRAMILEVIIEYGYNVDVEDLHPEKVQ
ncbi:hypothetical protein [Jeotgalibaca caeni]|uniref:hypothetical protein n=1 Tax=Jeotgalibaca caeni TaxID=3028623 RepID=UPI00237E154C|nr:hypothetical protein [Jeotgalibaca caeni]MDE1549922.1 hypothetical protein [Jeotgalibaca caeni]